MSEGGTSDERSMNLLVQQLDGLFEASELHHGVWDLSHPQWHQTLVESVHAFILGHLGPCFSQGVGEAWSCLDLDLGSFEWCEGCRKSKLS